MPKVRVVRGRHNAKDEKGRPVVYEEGDEFVTTDSRAEAFRDKLELVDKPPREDKKSKKEKDKDKDKE